MTGKLKIQLFLPLFVLLFHAPFLWSEPLKDVLEKGKIYLSAAGPIAIQAYYPSDFIKFMNRLTTPVGRIGYQVFFDGKNMFLYPVTAYWKLGHTTYLNPVTLSEKSARFK